MRYDILAPLVPRRLTLNSLARLGIPTVVRLYHVGLSTDSETLDTGCIRLGSHSEETHRFASAT
jgi:hypothetical protein